MPGVVTGDFGAGWHSTIDGTLDPVAATLALVEAGVKAGVKLVKAISLMTGAKEPGPRGEPEISRKTIAQGRPGVPVDL